MTACWFKNLPITIFLEWGIMIRWNDSLVRKAKFFNPISFSPKGNF